METYAFTQEDIDLITYSLRFVAKNAAFTGTQKDALELLEYIKRQANEKREEKQTNDL